MKFFMSKYLRITAICLTLGTTDFIQAEKIMLTNGYVKMLDGVRFALDGKNLLNMEAIKRLVIELLLGVEDPKTKKRIGRYEFEGKIWSFHALTMYEKELEVKFVQHKKELEQKYITRSAHYQNELDALEIHLRQKLQEELLKGEEHIKQTVSDESMHEFEEEKLKAVVLEKIDAEREQQHYAITRKHISEPSAYDKDLQELSQEYRNKLASLHAILEQAKQDFLKITNPFMEQAHGVKWALAHLIEESCIKRKRWDSYLLKWVNAKESEEIELFNTYMNTCQRLDTFCTDLCNFITDVINSCPKGYAQAKALIAAKAQEKNNN